MRHLRVLGPGFRIVIALLFGFMSLAHGPVMAFAQSQAPQAPQAHFHQPPAHHASSHSHHAAHEGMPAAHQRDSGPSDSICYGSACFTAVAPILAAAPATIFSPLRQLGPAAGRMLVPTDIGPTDPPPRLQD